MARYTIRDACGRSSWTIRCRLVGGRLFYTPHGGRILQLVLVDDNGETIEVKTNSLTKAYMVYKKAIQDRFYYIEGQGDIQQTDSEYTPTDYEFFGRGPQWIITELKGFTTSGTVRHTSCIKTALRKVESQGNANIVGYFKSIRKLPHAVKYPVGDDHLLQGYRVTLEDEDGETFEVTVWHTKRIDKHFELLLCEEGDPILFLGVRVDDYPGGRHTKFKTNYNPILDSNCIDTARVR